MELDALIAQVGARAVARHRRPRLDRPTAERLLTELIAQAGVRPPPRRAAATPAPAPGPERARPAAALRAAATRRPAVPRPGAPRARLDRDTLDETPDPFLDLHPAVDGKPRPTPTGALLRPPSRPLPRLPLPTPAPEPAEAEAEPSPTRAAMGALFEDDDSAGGLVLFGALDDDAGFTRQAGTDPDMAPLPAEGEGPTTAPDPEPGDEPRLAGAEEPMPMDAPAAPFGFGPGDAEPTVVDREAVRRRDSTAPPERAPGHLSEEVVKSSVRKLFRR